MTETKQCSVKEYEQNLLEYFHISSYACKSHPLTCQWQSLADGVLFYSCLSSTVCGDGWWVSRSGRFTSTKELRCTSNWKQGGSRGRSGWIQKSENFLPSPRFEPRNVQELKSLYTYYAILVPSYDIFINSIFCLTAGPEILPKPYKCSEVSISVVKCSWVKCSEVQQSVAV